MSSEIRLYPTRGIPEIRPGDDLGVMIVRAAQKMRLKLSDGDIITVAQKIVSKAEGRLVNLESVTPSEFAIEIASKQQRERHDHVLRRDRRRYRARQPGLNPPA